jgi:hypothetical protein
MKRIIWLASYPKSGNTWLRAFLTNYQQNRDEPADINELLGGPIASSRKLFDEWVGVEASDLTPATTARLRPLVYQKIAENSKETLFLKIHDANLLINNEFPLIPTDVTQGAIYLVRNPLDVAISFADHTGATLDRVIRNMGDSEFRFAGRDERLDEQLPQHLGTWSEHVHSWVDHDKFPVLVIKYEDLLTDPFERFGDIIRFGGLLFDHERLQRAIAFSSFNVLKEQEQIKGFKERSAHSKVFFRQGSAGKWQEVLSLEQGNRVIQDHRVMMERFGYLPGG